MILAYYGRYIRPEKLKRKGNIVSSGTRKSSQFMAQKLKSLGFEFIIISDKNKELFNEIVKYSIDNGIPLRWSCNMRFSPVKKERSNSSHARIITGYIKGGNKITHIFYTDSWGANHMNKTMTFDQAAKMTNRYGPVFPKKDNQQYFEQIHSIIEQYVPKRQTSVSSSEDIEEDWGVPLKKEIEVKMPPLSESSTVIAAAQAQILPVDR